MKKKKILYTGALALAMIGIGATQASAAWIGTVPSQDKLTLSAKLVSRKTKEIRVNKGYIQHQQPYYQVGNYLYCDYWYTIY